MRFKNKTLKTCLIFSCLLCYFSILGSPRINGATFFMDTKNEVWKDIPNYEGIYQVSDQGRVRSLLYRKYLRRIPKVLTPNSNGLGYLKTSLCPSGTKPRTRYIHRLVAITFIKNPKKYPCVDHINGNKQDNRLINLRYCSHRENVSFENVKHKNKTSKFVGVSFENDSKKWRSEIYINGIPFRIGRFKNELDAAMAYQQKLKEIS